MKVSNEKFLSHIAKLGDNIRLAESKEIAVGLPKGFTLTRKVYKKSKLTVLDVGIVHEYGLGNNPVRSFLRVPFSKKSNDIKRYLQIGFSKIADKGDNVIKQMELIGAAIKDISLGAFNTKGYGTWLEIKEQTRKKKNTNAILTHTGTLKQSIREVVRDAT